MKKKYIISACLCGVNCKYNGGNNLNSKCKEIYDRGEAILVCPEQLGGLSTPRDPSEIINYSSFMDENRIVVKSNKDVNVTNEFLQGAKKTLSIAQKHDISKAILKEGSPSCGSKFIYDGTFSGKKIKGVGVTTYILKNNGIDVCSDEDII